MNIFIFFDFKAILITLVIFSICSVLSSKSHSLQDRLLQAGSLTQSFAVAFGIVYFVRTLSVLDSIDTIGPPLAVSLLTILYGTILNITMRLYNRFIWIE